MAEKTAEKITAEKPASKDIAPSRVGSPASNLKTKKAVKKKSTKKKPKTAKKIDKKGAVLPLIDLTEKEERFCVEYAASDNAVKAFRYVWSGYAYNSAAVQSGRLLKKPYIKDRVDVLRAERRERLTPTADKILGELMKLAFYDPRNFFDDDGRLKPLSELDPDHAAVIGGIETFHKITGDDKDGLCVTTKIKLPDKNAALEKLGKNLMLWKEGGSKDNPLIVINKVELVALT